MAKLNYQKLARDTALSRQPILDGKTITKKQKFNAPVKLNGPNHILKFGQHKGKALKEVPTEYIMWAIRNITDSKVDMFIRELQRRDSFYRI